MKITVDLEFGSCSGPDRIQAATELTIPGASLIAGIEIEISWVRPPTSDRAVAFGT